MPLLFDGICRVCESTVDLEMIFDKVYENTLLMLRDTGDSAINENDGLPHHICLRCRLTLEEFHKFKSMYRRTYGKFRMKIGQIIGFSQKIRNRVYVRKDSYFRIECKEKKFQVGSDSKDDKRINPVEGSCRNKSLNGLGHKHEIVVKEEIHICDKDEERERQTNPETPSNKKSYVLDVRQTISEKDNSYQQYDVDSQTTIPLINCKQAGLRRNCEIFSFKSAYSQSTAETTHDTHEYKISDAVPQDASFMLQEASPNPLLSEKHGNIQIEEVFKEHKELHLSSISKTCDECGKSFTTLRSLKMHLELHKNPNLFKCDECGKAFTTARNLKQHKDSHTDLCKCDHCGKSFSTFQRLKAHVTLHKHPDLYKCDECGKSSTSAYNLKKHKVIHSKLSKCEECGRCFASLQNFKVHLALHKNPDLYKCNICGKRFSRPQLFKIHMTLHLNPNLSKCEECGKSFANLRNFKLHVALHKNPDLFKCDMCDKVFTAAKSLRDHKFSHSNLNKCDECGKSFANLPSFNAHVTLHKNPDLYKCEECGKSFARLQKLKEHQVSHSDASKCDKCWKSFGTLQSLKEHLAFHSNPDRYKCNDCRKCFSRAQHLKHHKCSHFVNEWIESAV